MEVLKEISKREEINYVKENVIGFIIFGLESVGIPDEVDITIDKMNVVIQHIPSLKRIIRLRILRLFFMNQLFLFISSISNDSAPEMK